MESSSSRTITMEAVVDVDAPAAEAWSVLADYARDVEWRRGVRSMVPTPSGPVRSGTTTVEEMRAAGRTLHNDGVVTAVADGRRFTWRTTSGVDADGSREVEPLESDGCRVRLVQRVRPPGMFGLVPGLLRRSLQKTLTADAARLRTVIELGEVTGRDDTAGPDLTESGFTSGGESRDRDGSSWPDG